MFSPIVQRELHGALRKHAPIGSRFRAGWIAGAVSLVFLLLGLISPSAVQGSYFYLFYGSLFLAVARPMKIAAGLISEERRQQTLELLFLAGTTPL